MGTLAGNDKVAKIEVAAEEPDHHCLVVEEEGRMEAAGKEKVVEHHGGDGGDDDGDVVAVVVGPASMDVGNLVQILVHYGADGMVDAPMGKMEDGMDVGGRDDDEDDDHFLLMSKMMRNLKSKSRSYAFHHLFCFSFLVIF